MARTVTMTEISRNFSEYLNRVAYQGEHFLLLRGKKVLAELKPAPRGRRLGELPTLVASLPHLSSREADAFLKDLSKARVQLAKKPLRARWES